MRNFNFIIYFVLLFILLCFNNIVYSQKSQRTIAPIEWRRLTNTDEFNYANEVEQPQKAKEPEEPNFFYEWLIKFFRFFSGKEGQILIWIIVVISVVYFLYRIIFNKENLLFFRNKKLGVKEGASNTDDEILQTDWEDLLQKIIEKGSFSDGEIRFATRYCYMLVLQILQNKELIRYKADKTNYDYALELETTPYKQVFRQLSRQYEYSWYGNCAMSLNMYQEYYQLFTDFKNKLNK